jgi:LCP family protein required for cell wall assembly
MVSVAGVLADAETKHSTIRSVVLSHSVVIPNVSHAQIVNPTPRLVRSPVAPNVTIPKAPSAPLIKQAAPQPATEAFNQPSSIPASDDDESLLVLGVDANKSKTRFQGARSDTTMLVSIKPSIKKIAITSIPRDSRVFIKGHGENKINAAHALGGPELTQSTVQSTFGVPIRHYVVIDTAGLRKVCQLLGPLEINVEKRMKYTDNAGHLYVDLKPGKQLLSPTQVEEYVRFRHDQQSDIGRIQRQQWFIRTAFAKLYDPTFICRLPQVIAVARDSIKTNLSLPDMIRIAMSVQGIKSNEIMTASLPGRPENIRKVSYWILDMPASRYILKRMYSDGMTPPAVANLPTPIHSYIEYSAGSEKDAQALENSLKATGMCVKLKRAEPLACAHEKIVLSSPRVSAGTVETLRKEVPMISSWPQITSASEPGSDLTFVIAPHKS